MIFVRKNPTPEQLAFFTGLNVAGWVFALLFWIKLILPDGLAWWMVFSLPVVVLTVTYFAVTEALTRFIYRKIKLVYKTIHRHKGGNAANTPIDLRTHILDDVEREVREWASDRRREVEELKLMAEYRRDFVGNVSHELKTPIFNLQGYLYTLLDGGIDDDNIRMPYLQKAVDNTERLAAIVEDLMAIAKLESTTLTLNMQRFNIVELCKEVMEDLEFMAEDRNIHLGFKETPRRQTWVLGDRESIRQVFTNLISNSIKYGRENGRTLISFYDLDNTLLIEISDDGIGIGKEHLPRIFERFYRVDSSRTRDTGGTGLGLSIVKHIIEAHNQTINVRSSENMGTTFGFTLEKTE